MRLPGHWAMLLSAGLTLVNVVHAVSADEVPAAPPKELLGRWDLVVDGPEGKYPSWLEVKLSGYRTLVGSYVGQFGSARPVAKIEVQGPEFRFAVPPQWERRTTDVVVAGRLDKDVLTGTVTGDKGEILKWKGTRAPELRRAKPPVWGKPVELFNGRDLTGWKVQHAGAKNGWKVIDGILTNAEPGNNLLTEKAFTDFQLRVEFRYPARSNSGIFLRGRYELQIEDNFGQEAESHKIGGVYGHLTPAVNAAKKPGEWQTYEASLAGRVLTLTLNGERVIDRQVIPGITGGALDSDEGAPGPILLQGDHGPVEFRKITLTPAE